MKTAISIIQRNIRYERIIAEMNQKELADKLRCSRALVTQWEGGWTNVTDKWMVKIAAIFHISLERLTASDPKHVVVKELIRKQIMVSNKEIKEVMYRCETKIDQVLHLMQSNS